MQAFGGEYHAPTTEAYLNSVLLKLAPAADGSAQSYRITLLNSPVVNAFALPSGDIFVTRGLLALAEDTSEIAAVMAHEIAHVTARHAAQRAEFEKTAALFTRVNAQVLEHAAGGRRGGGALETVDRPLFAPAGIRGRPDRHQEHGERRLRPLWRGAFPHRARRMERAERVDLGGGTADRPDMTATHPSTPERVAAGRGGSPAVRAPGGR